ncbi:DM13 domain-containing protein, partial [Klebsiella pneumoniae]
ARYTGAFFKNQKGSNAVHWVDGKLYVSDQEIAFEGSIAPGPDYKIYLTKTQADDRNSFLKIKEESLYIGDLKNYGNFKKNLPNGVNIDEYTTVQIWCEKFEQFIGSAQYR